MARFNDPAEVRAAFAPYLEDGEQIRHVGYGVRQPPMPALLVVSLLGAGALWRASRHYLVALTDRRLVVLRFEDPAMAIVEERSWPLGELPPVKASSGGLFTHIAIEDPARPFTAKFHRLGMPNQREEAQAIAAALTGKG